MKNVLLLLPIMGLMTIGCEDKESDSAVEESEETSREEAEESEEETEESEESETEEE
jgi:hypothetical protein